MHFGGRGEAFCSFLAHFPLSSWTPVGRRVCGCSTTGGLIFGLHLALSWFHLSCSLLPWSITLEHFALVPLLPVPLTEHLCQGPWFPPLGLTSLLAMLRGPEEVKEFTQRHRLIIAGTGIGTQSLASIPCSPELVSWVCSRNVGIPGPQPCLSK